MQQKYLSFAIFAAMLSLASVAHADDVCQDESAENCKEIITNSPTAHVELAPMSVVVNRTITPVATYAGQVSVLNEQDLKTHANIIENLAQVPGFETGDDFGRQIGSQFKIRGFGYQTENRVIIQQDGVKRSPSMFSNHISSFRVDNNLLKNTEVVKGGSSVLHGGGAIGGIVSMKTKSAEDFISDGKEQGVTIGARFDSNNGKSGHLAYAAKPTNSPFDVLIYGRKAHYGDIKLADGGVVSGNQAVSKTPNDEDIDTAVIKLGYDISDEQRLVLSHYKFNEKLTTAWQTLWHQDIPDDPIHGKLKQDDTTLSYEYKPKNNSLIDIEGNLYRSEASYYRTRDGSSPISYLNNDKRWGLGLKNHAMFNLGKVNNDLVIGVDYEDRKEDALMISNGYVSDFGSMPNFYKDLGVYAQNIFDFGKVDLTVGARFDRFERGVKREGRQKYSESHLSPKVALSFEPIEGVYLLANYAETFRGPTPHETSSDGALNPHYWYVPNMDLKPEVAKEYETGLAISRGGLLGDDDLYVKATYFDGKIKDMISVTLAPELGVPPDLGDGYYGYRRYVRYSNIAEAKRKGYEIEAKYRYKDWYFGAGYDHLKLTNGKTNLPLQPVADKYYFNARYEHADSGLSVGAKVTRWAKPKRDEYSFTQRGRTYYYVNEPYTITDIYAGWTPSDTGVRFLDDGFKLNVGINNVFDDKRIHYSNVTETTAVGKGRNIYLAVEKRF